jgi:hypothetical protein
VQERLSGGLEAYNWFEYGHKSIMRQLRWSAVDHRVDEAIDT